MEPKTQKEGISLHAKVKKFIDSRVQSQAILLSQLSLSREEKDELARGKKKVKDVSHAGFSEGPSSSPSSPSNAVGSWKQGLSFKDKLVGEIPGAYTQAFNIGAVMEDDVDSDADSDEEVETLRQGLVAVKFSKEFKQRIRRPWSRALIVNAYGRTVGLNFLQAKLLAMWKPAGRLDCVDLGHGFLTRLSLKEDENILRKGPWFIGDHFLSFRPWEPNFRLVSANVSSIAVWIRLYELPIEYYNVDALQHIGKAIGNVLRVDTFTTMETRGRFARLCVQIDVEKPLVTAIMIGRLEQTLSYEGIQKLCFKCGRMGHSKESCPYTIRQEPLAREVLREDGMEEGEGAHEKRKANSPKNGVGPNSQVHDAVQEVVHVGMQGSDRAEVAFGLAKENKRKLSPTRVLEGAQVESSIQKIRNEDLKQAQPNSTQDQEPNLLRSQTALKYSSVKGKKVLERQRVSQHSSLSALDSVIGRKFLGEHVKGNTEELVKDGGICDGDASKGFQFNAAVWSEMGCQFRGGNCGDSRGSVGEDKRKSNSSVGVVQWGVEDSMEVCGSFDKDECEEWVGPSNKSGLGESFKPVVEFSVARVRKSTLGTSDGCFVQCESNGVLGRKEVAREATNSHLHYGKGTNAEGAKADRMDFEGGGEADGARKPSFHNRVRELVQNHNLAVLVVMKTRVGGERARELTDKLPFDKAIHTDTIGFAGGLWVLWIRIGWSPRNAERQVLWNNLMKLAELHSLPWVIAGDFNEPLLDEDKFGGRARAVANRPSNFLLNLEKGLLKELDLVLNQEEELWALKSRVNWMMQGDRNTAFYHVSTLVRRKRNQILAIKNVMGDWIYEEEEIKNFIRSGFEGINSTSLTCAIRADPPISQWQPRLTKKEKKNISGGASKDEIKSALWSLKPFKAPGPDGMHAGFFQRFWPIVGRSVVSEVQKIFDDRRVPDYLNRTHITLISKIQGPETLGNYRPISLCNTVYKVVTKIIVTRLRPYRDKLISPLQAAFVPGRKGVDNAIIAQEMIHSLGKKRGRVGYMALKIDLEKAYDKLEWNFIREALLRANLPADLIDIIMSPVSTVSTSILINGEATDPIFPSRGIRQGDPLSLYLFILCMDYLGQLIEEKCSAKRCLVKEASSLEIKDFMLDTGWDWGKIPFEFPQEIKMMIQATPTAFMSRGIDKLAWAGSSKGTFELKSAYKIAIDTLPRIKTFLWLYAHNSIGVKVCLGKRGVVNDNICPNCQRGSETILHALRDCPHIKHVWNQLGITSINHGFWRSDLQTWLSIIGRNNCSLLAANPPWRIMFPFAMWNIWKSRNGFVFSNKSSNPKLAGVILNQAWEFIHCVSSLRVSTRKVMRSFCWEKPPEGWLKLNTDGLAEEGSGLACCGEVIRDANGHWISDFNKRIGTTNSFAVELLGLREGLLLCRRLNIAALVIELDAESIVNVLNNPSYANNSISPILDDCRVLVSLMQQIQIMHYFC
ncbi:uncharacterized protein LOC142632618 [Castanea sativa]|uniref:uncharacterized protein LOC142632618 n=1 Tax=Castanea sativa TaxID=21020 RepID=UPI003F64A8F1